MTATDIPIRHEQPPTVSAAGRDVARYPSSLRVLHWTRAVLVIGLVGTGWLMTSLGDAVPLKYGTLYPTHKSFGLLVFGIVVVQIAIRLSTKLRHHPLPASPLWRDISRSWSTPQCTCFSLQYR